MLNIVAKPISSNKVIHLPDKTIEVTILYFKQFFFQQIFFDVFIVLKIF